MLVTWCNRVNMTCDIYLFDELNVEWGEIINGYLFEKCQS